MNADYEIQLSRKLFYIEIAVFVVLITAGIILKINNIPITKINPYPCVLYTITGLYCPGCGGTRAVVELLHGHIIKSIEFHPVVLYTFLLSMCYLFSHILNIFTKGKIKAMLFRPMYFYIMIAVIAVQFIIKNVFVIFAGIHLI